MLSRCERKEVKEVVKTVVKGKKDVGKAEVRDTTKWIPPDVGAMCFILKTKRREKWSERQKVDSNDGNLVINVAPATKKDDNE